MAHLNLNLLTSKDTLSAAIALLYCLRGVPEYTVMSELPYILDSESLVRFIKYYGGRTIKVPTSDELNDQFKVLILYQKFRVEELPWLDALSLAGYSQQESGSARMRLSVFERLLREQEIGGREYE